MSYKNLLLEEKNNVAFVTINRPEKMNALNYETLDEIQKIFEELKSREEIRCVVITGAGEKAFVAGADIKELAQLDVIKGNDFALRGQKIFSAIEKFDKPVIAAINGFTLGGGAELAWSCHIRIASENAKFGQPEVNLGIIPGYGGTQRMSRLINAGRALEYILTGDMIDANEAFRLGLVSKVVPQSDLINTATTLAEKIASKPALAVKYSLNAVQSIYENSLSEGLNYEASLFALSCGTNDFKEGTSAFLEKRKANFSHS